jgi:hypothetical protein
MVLRDTLLRGHVAKHRFGAPVVSSHTPMVVLRRAPVDPVTLRFSASS